MSVIRKEAYYASCNNVNKIRALIWHDEMESPVGIVQIAHGIGEHIGRYDEFARFLVSCGFVVCGNDHLGHGKSAGTPAELGYVYEGDHINMLRDMNTLQKIMSRRYTGLPFFLFGHSMGSFLARIYSASFGSSLAGAIYCATGQLPLPALMIKGAATRLIDRLPENSNAVNTVNILFGKFTKKILNDNDDLAWISQRRENIENIKNDPMCNFPLKAPLAKELVILASKASDPVLAYKLPADFPILIISGARDPIGMFGRGVLAVSDALVKAGHSPHMILYPGDRHEILNEDDRYKVFADIKQFLKGVINGISEYK